MRLLLQLLASASSTLFALLLVGTVLTGPVAADATIPLLPANCTNCCNCTINPPTACVLNNAVRPCNNFVCGGCTCNPNNGNPICK